MREHRLGPKVAALLGAFAVVAGLAVLTLAPGDRPNVARAEAGASIASSRVKLSTIGRFSSPVLATVAPGDASRLFVVEQAGTIRVVRAGRTLPKPFLDISRQVGCCYERGLLGLAFAPDYRSTGRFYVDYTNTDGDSRIVEYRRSATDADRADPATARTVLAQQQPQSNHNGGHIVFGPDGLLYIGFGDGGGADDQHGAKGNGQDLGTLLGKILRIDPRQSGSDPYTVPADNPFVSTAGARSEIWSWGLRNPWRFSFDRSTGGLAIGDVGQGDVEEVDWSRSPVRGRGVNFGWRPWEGTRRMPQYSTETADGAVFPVLEYRHGRSGCSVTGGYVVRDQRLRTSGYWGRYLFGDFCSGRLWSVDMREGRLAATVKSTLPFRYDRLVSFGEDGAGRIHLVSHGGRVARLDPA